MNLPPTTSSADCDRYWDDADWLPPWFILDRWCQQDAPCRHAKQQALLSACERGEVHYQRRDGKTFDDPVHELLARGLLLIERASFDAWATRLDGKSPLPEAQTVNMHRKPVAIVQPPWVKSICPSAPVNSTPPQALPPQTAPQPLVVECNTDSPVKGNRSASDKKHDYSAYPSDTELRKLGVPFDEIVAAFPIESTRHENEKWWRTRMANVSRANKGLAVALVQIGLPNVGEKRYPSWWRPDLVVRWLADAKHLPIYRGIPILKEKFPAWAKDTDSLL